MEPGPGVGGPGPGVLPPTLPPAMIPVSMPSVQVLFARPEGMQIRWDVSGMTPFDSTPLDRSRPAEFSAERHLSDEADEHSGPRRDGAVSDG